MKEKTDANSKKPVTATEKPKPEDYDIQTIERHIQNLLNLLIKGLQRLRVEEATFDRFQGVFYSSDSLEEYLDGLHEMLKVLVAGTEKRLDELETAADGAQSGNRQGDLRENTRTRNERKKKRSKNHSPERDPLNEDSENEAGKKNNYKNRMETENALSDPNYENLEKVLQKYEAEIREHIRIEQQLKIYSDGLEEKVAEKEAEMAVQAAGFKKQIAVLNEDKAKLSKMLYDAKFERIFLEKKLKKGRESGGFNVRDSREPSLRKAHRVKKLFLLSYSLRLRSHIIFYFYHKLFILKFFIFIKFINNNFFKILTLYIISKK